MLPIFDMKPSGRLCVRMASGGFATTGVLHFPSSFRPEEGTAYPLVIGEDGAFEAVPYALARMDRAELDGSITDWGNQKSWPQMQRDGFAARFVQAFENGWTTVAVTRNDPFEGVLPPEQRKVDHGHYWVDVTDGVVTAIEPPVQPKRLMGTALSQICSNFCVWPDAEGRPHTLPVLTRETRRAFEVVGEVTGLLAQKKLSEDAANQLLRSPGLYGLGGSLGDPQYLEYRAVVEKYGMRRGFGEAMSREKFQRTQEWSRLAVEALLGQGLDEPGVARSLRLAADAREYERAPSYLVAKAWDYLPAQGSQKTVRWVFDPSANDVLSAQVHNGRDWHAMSRSDVQDLAECLRDDCVAQAPEKFDLATVKTLPLWAIRDLAAAAENQPKAPQAESGPSEPSM